MKQGRPPSLYFSAKILRKNFIVMVTALGPMGTGSGGSEALVRTTHFLIRFCLFGESGKPASSVRQTREFIILFSKMAFLRNHLKFIMSVSGILKKA